MSRASIAFSWLAVAAVVAFAPGAPAAEILVARRNGGFIELRDRGGWTTLRLADVVEGSPDICSAGEVLILAARGRDQSVRIARRVRGSWEPWRTLDGKVTSDVALTCTPDGHARVFARGTDGAVWTRSTVATQAWHSLGGLIEGAPDAASGPGGRIDVVARGMDGMAWHDVTIGDDWLGWRSLGVSTSRPPAIVRVTPDRLDVITVNSDGAVQIGTLPNEGPLSVAPLDGGILTGSARAHSLGTGEVVVAGRGSDGAAWIDTLSGGAWSGWQPRGGSVLGDVGVAADPIAATSVATVPAGCALRVSQTTWGRQNPVGAGGMRWNVPDSCVEPGALLPFRREDLEQGEAIFVQQWRHAPATASGMQVWGYDISSARLAATSSGATAWSVTRTGNVIKNEDSLIYGQPVHAMTAGRVVRCWRNAPENETWGAIHPARASRLIGGSGNFVVIEEDDGDRIWYAHAQPGSIPEALCPNNATYLQHPNDEVNLDLQEIEADVPAALQARVRAGDFLFLVGNSGQSSGPHLHVHAQRGQPSAPEPVALGFSGGSFSSAMNPPAAFKDVTWTPLANDPIPPGPVVLVPQ